MSTRRRFLAGALALGLPFEAMAQAIQGDDRCIHEWHR